VERPIHNSLIIFIHEAVESSQQKKHVFKAV